MFLFFSKKQQCHTYLNTTTPQLKSLKSECSSRQKSMILEKRIRKLSYKNPKPKRKYLTKNLKLRPTYFHKNAKHPKKHHKNVTSLQIPKLKQNKKPHYPPINYIIKTFFKNCNFFPFFYIQKTVY